MKQLAREDAAEHEVRAAEREYLPLGIDVSGLACLVVGGGRVGTRKALTLARAGALVTVLSPELSPRLAGAAAQEEIAWLEATYSPDALAGKVLVVAATNDPRLNLSIRDDCEKRGVLSCVASPGRSSRVVFPAVHKVENLTVAVHSDGRDCAASRDARDRIAGVLRAPQGECPRLCVLGVERGSVPEGFFAQLGAAAGQLAEARLAGRDFSEAMVLATCQRWECWFLATSPAAGARELRGRVHQRCELLLEGQIGNFYLKSGPAAHLHLLEVASGLRSPLPAETEIIGQLRAARDSFLREENSQLRKVCDDVLGRQRRIRCETGLAPVGGGWVEHAMARVMADSAEGRMPRVLVLGMGRLGTKLRGRLRRKGLQVSAVSRRTAQDGEEVFPPERLDELLAATDIAVLTSAGERERAILRHREEAGNLRVVDLSSVCGVRGIGRSDLRGEDVLKITNARALCLEHALSTAPRDVEKRRLRLGARGSRLSRTQIEETLRFAKQVLPATGFGVITMDTPGDRDRSTPLPAVREEDFFTRDLDRALIEGRIDLAAHSAKDLPSALPDGLVVAAVLPSVAPWECLVAREGLTLDALPEGAVVGTSSARRRDWLLARRPELVAREIRGNVHDRVARLDAGEFDALLLAAAGLVRLGMAQRISQVFDLEDFAPPAGQGSLALMIRAGDHELRGALAPLDLGSREGLPWTLAAST